MIKHQLVNVPNVMHSFSKTKIIFSKTFFQIPINESFASTSMAHSKIKLDIKFN